ncbi:MAG: lipopolysaccharide heptosyltransferase II, partial [Candidatus Omnitrophica bacterium]|nr:lipopolysaccharide heptosyltransferase II [Candidatus Omnitrophota bacterium]
DKVYSQAGKEIVKHCPGKIYNFTGLTNLRQLAALLKHASLFITVDTGVLHLASYLNVSTLALFGASRPEKYGPWCDKYKIMLKELFCRPCERAQCKFKHLNCMRLIKAENVAVQAKNYFSGMNFSVPKKVKITYKRILIVRTDKVGDVLLTTPVIKGLRREYPDSYIAMVVRPYSENIVCDNPYLDEVFIYDKLARHKNWYNSMRFAWELRKKRFDLAIIFHPTNRMHILTFFAGIERRIGYDRKTGFLLTDKIKHTKQLGQKHELEYNLDLLRYLGIEVEDKSLYLAIDPVSRKWQEDLFFEKGIKEIDQVLIINPSAGAQDRIWPAERFAQVADRLIAKYNFKAFVIGSSQDSEVTITVVNTMRQPVIDLTGKTSLSQVVSLLKSSTLLISNDSGPVHIACAVGIPVISIFGRNQKGLSPKRWGPTGARARVLHKQVGCVECLAHKCLKDFACLAAISVEEVIQVADELLALTP